MISQKEFEAANRRAKIFAARNPRAVDVHYHHPSGMIDIALSSGAHFSFPARDAETLEDASPAQLKDIEISSSGYGLHFPKLDADLYIPALLEGVFGSRKWMAARLGQTGGKSRSTAKRAASRANGKLGGRPRKKSA